MAKTIGRLTALQVKSADLKPGLCSDGGNLYLRVAEGGNRSWVLIYRINGKQREAGLGKAGEGKGVVTLKAARAQAKKGRDLLDQRPKVDPLTVWKATATSAPTFKEAAEDYIDLHAPTWRHPKHAAQWRNSISAYCKPLYGLPIDQIDTQAVLKVLKPIWTRVPETASRVRGRIEAILDYAKADDETRPNPARWRGHLAKKLPSAKHLDKTVRRAGGVIETVKRGHFAALPYADIPAFVTRLRALDGVAARGLEFLLLTATRSSETRGAKWSEIDFAARKPGGATWTIPIERLKNAKAAKQPFVIPLSDRAVEILKEMRAVASGDFVFPGRFDNRPLSAMAFFILLRSMGLGGITTHGFRSTFRDYAGDETHFPREVAEAALGHVIGGVEAAYRRGDALKKRRELMDAWSRYCGSTPLGDDAGDSEAEEDNVVRFAARAV
jgi:integrase